MFTDTFGVEHGEKEYNTIETTIKIATTTLFFVVFMNIYDNFIGNPVGTPFIFVVFVYTFIAIFAFWCSTEHKHKEQQRMVHVTAVTNQEQHYE